MKKLTTTIIFAIAFGMNVNAQNDGFFSHGNYTEYRGTTEWGNLPTLPASHSLDYDYEAACTYWQRAAYPRMAGSGL